MTTLPHDTPPTPENLAKAQPLEAQSPQILQARLLELQTLAQKGAELTTEQIREAVTIIRILRRTNTGPAARKTSGAPGSKGKKPVKTIDLNTLFD